ncbi:MAG TPA: diacylglycerol kinase family lipid kinase [Thermoanaerobaculaceae bacterium]|nr:diacylglycerol kinase family lipid kinase [Thermoanaerobaculaceae bacterium]
MIAIVNPAAAGGRLGKNWPRLHRRLQDAGFDPPLAFTEAPGHATVLAADAVRRGETLVVAAGGDGTICEVVQGLHDAGGATLGILPLGTGNDAARTLGLPLRLEAAAQAILDGRTRTVDLILAGDRVALNAIGIGLLGAINVNAASIKLVRGIAAYLGAAAGTLFRYRCPEIALTDGAFSYRGAMTILAVHNGVTTGGGFPLTPAAVPDDGALDACLVEGTRVPARLSRLVAGVRGTLSKRPGSHELRFTRLELETDVSIPCHFDGNPSSIEPPGMAFSVLPRAQTVITSVTRG